MFETDGAGPPGAAVAPCALTELYREYFGQLTTRVRRFPGVSLADAEDIVQDVFAALAAKPKGWNPKQGIEAYLYGAVRNRVIKRQRHARVVQNWITECLSDPQSRIDPAHPATGMYVRDIAACVRRVVNTLSPRYGDVYKLRHMEHRSVKEIAWALLIDEQSVCRYLNKAYNSIHVALTKAGIPYTRKKTVRSGR